MYRNGIGRPIASVFFYFAVNAIRPGVNPAGKVPDLTEASFIQKLHRLGAPRSHLADGDNLLVRVEFMHPFLQLGKRNEVPANVRGFILVLVAHIEQKEFLASIQPLLQFFDLDFSNAHCCSPHQESIQRMPFRRTHIIFSPKTQNPPASLWRWVSIRCLLKTCLLALQSPRARRHVCATHTSATTRTGLLGVENDLAIKITSTCRNGKI